MSEDKSTATDNAAGAVDPNALLAASLDRLAGGMERMADAQGKILAQLSSSQEPATNAAGDALVAELANGSVPQINNLVEPETAPAAPASTEDRVSAVEDFIAKAKPFIEEAIAAGERIVAAGHASGFAGAVELLISKVMGAL